MLKHSVKFSLLALSLALGACSNLPLGKSQSVQEINSLEALDAYLTQQVLSCEGRYDQTNCVNRTFDELEKKWFYVRDELRNRNQSASKLSVTGSYRQGEIDKVKLTLTNQASNNLEFSLLNQKRFSCSKGCEMSYRFDKNSVKTLKMKANNEAIIGTIDSAFINELKSSEALWVELPVSLYGAKETQFKFDVRGFQSNN